MQPRMRGMPGNRERTMEHPDKVRWRRAEPEELSYVAVAEEEVNVSETKM